MQEAWVMLVKHDAQLGEALGRSQMHGRFALPATRRKVNAFLYFTERRRMATTRTWEPMERASAPRLSSDLTVLKWPLAAACMSADPVAIPPHQHTSTEHRSTEARSKEEQVQVIEQCTGIQSDPQMQKYAHIQRVYGADGQFL